SAAVRRLFAPGPACPGGRRDKIRQDPLSLAVIGCPAYPRGTLVTRASMALAVSLILAHQEGLVNSPALRARLAGGALPLPPAAGADRAGATGKFSPDRRQIPAGCLPRSRPWSRRRRRRPRLSPASRPPRRPSLLLRECPCRGGLRPLRRRQLR